MGNCKYCNKDAGFLKSKHPECEAKYNNGCKQIIAILVDAFSNNIDFYLLDSKIKEIVSKSYISADRLQQIFVSAFDTSIDNFLNDGLISEQESRLVARFQQYSNLPQSILNANKSLERVVQSSILQSILSGIIPTPPITINGALPFLLQKNEKLLWLFRNVQCYEQKVRKEYIGRSQGMSFRVMKGVYYRVGGFKGTPVETTHNELVGTGTVGVTDKYLYFSSSQKSLKIAYNKLINIEPYSDGLGLQKDGATARPIFLKGMDSWFVYNLITNLSRI